MPSVVGLLEQRELTAPRRVDELREEADRIHAELDVAEREWNEWVIARSRVGEVLAPDDDAVASEDPRHPDGQPVRSEPADAAKPTSVVPMWHAGLAWSALSVDYQRILQALADRNRLGQGPLTCQEMAACFGLDPVPGKVEALRSKAKRLDQGYEPWGSDGLTPSFGICACCFSEFGYEDATNAGVRAAREAWIQAGCPWRGPESEQPAGWDPRAQLEQGLRLPHWN